MTNVVANVTYIISVTWTHAYCKLFCLIYAVFPGVAKWAFPSGGSVGKGAKGEKDSFTTKSYNNFVGCIHINVAPSLGFPLLFVVHAT